MYKHWKNIAVQISIIVKGPFWNLYFTPPKDNYFRIFYLTSTRSSQQSTVFPFLRKIQLTLKCWKYSESPTCWSRLRLLSYDGTRESEHPTLFAWIYTNMAAGPSCQPWHSGLIQEWISPFLTIPAIDSQSKSSERKQNEFPRSVTIYPNIVLFFRYLYLFTCPLPTLLPQKTALNTTHFRANEAAEPRPRRT